MKLKISQTLTHILESRRLTIKEVSKATGVPMSSISGWKKDNRSPHAEQAGKVARHLGVTVHFLLFLINSPRVEDIKYLINCQAGW